MLEQPKRRSKREDLIKVGIDEINQHGLGGFSIRRVAYKCNVSCAAPSKHFGDKKGFIAAIIEFVNAQWHNEQLRILKENSNSVRNQLVELSVCYVRFLVCNPHFRSILMLKDDNLDNVYHTMRGELSNLAQKLVNKYCEEVNMDAETKTRKLYVVRALIYGAALMFDNGEMEYNEKMLDVVRKSIDREFDLP